MSSNVDSAWIYLDDKSTGSVTPDTVVATTGTHLVRLEKKGFISAARTAQVARDSTTTVILALNAVAASRIVLIEDFSNVSCVPCISSNMILHALVGGTYGRSRLVVVKYATNFPSPNDPFYLAAQALCDSRMAYYHILFAPTLVLDGLLRPTPTDSLSIKDAIETSLTVAPRFSLAITSSMAGNLYSADISVRILDTTGVDFSKLVLHTVLVETDIVYSSPPGANGETVFHDVARAMLPTFDGEALATGPSGSTQTYHRTASVASTWQSSKLNTVVFIQDRLSKTIYQTGSTY